MMKFYDRESELERLHGMQRLSQHGGRMTFVVGRRRIGKTMLLLEATRNTTTLYFFVARKSEVLLCQDFIGEIRHKLAIPVLGEFKSFTDLFRLLLEHSKSVSFNLIVDEFQEFQYINPSVYSDMQHHWDLNKAGSRMNLLLCGSVYSMMQQIFENRKEPLFGRADMKLHVRSFPVPVLKEILQDHHPEWSHGDLLALYTLTGGIPRYIQWFIDHRSLTLEKMVKFIASPDSPVIQEGRSMLIQEFGKDYAVYFSILAAISQGHNSRHRIESLLNQEIGGGYLTRLERDYGLISRVRPIFSKSESRSIRYVLSDPFLTFWFRFIFKYSHFIESGGYDELRSVILRDYATFSGLSLERYFMEKLTGEGGFTRIGGYWDSKGENEIDLIAVNDLEKRAVLMEIKVKPAQLRMEKLKLKSEHLLLKHPWLQEYRIELRGLSEGDM